MFFKMSIYAASVRLGLVGDLLGRRADREAIGWNPLMSEMCCVWKPFLCRRLHIVIAGHFSSMAKLKYRIKKHSCFADVCASHEVENGPEKNKTLLRRSFL